MMSGAPGDAPGSRTPRVAPLSCGSRGSRGSRGLRAAAVAGVWGLGLAPVALGWQRCVWATLLRVPCPGCGMTRAIRLLAAGRFGDSLRMHALAVPVLAVGLLIIASTVWTTLQTGSPLFFYKTRLGRASIRMAVLAYSAAWILWVLRGWGLFGGPAPV